MRILGILSFGVLILVASPNAIARSSQTDKIIKKAVDAYADLDFEKALVFMKKAEAQTGNSRDQLSRIYEIMGICQSSLGQYDEARKTFLKLLSLDPSFRLGTEISPRVKRPFIELQKQSPSRFEVRLIPPAGAWKGKPISLSFEVVGDPANMLRYIKVWYKLAGQKKYSIIRTRIKTDQRRTIKRRFLVSIPPPFVKGDKATLMWYATAEGENYSTLQHFNDARHPAELVITDRAKATLTSSTPWYKRWWIWTIVGSVAVAGAATAAVLATNSTGNGPFDFNVSFSTAK